MKNEAEILKLLKEKSATKQLIYRNTKEVFDDLVVSLKSKEKSLTSLLKNEVENVELEFKSNGSI
jgi:CTP-dependent riboflavin kinase